MLKRSRKHCRTTAVSASFTTLFSDRVVVLSIKRYRSPHGHTSPFKAAAVFPRNDRSLNIALSL